MVVPTSPGEDYVNFVWGSRSISFKSSAVCTLKGRKNHSPVSALSSGLPARLGNLLGVARLPQAQHRAVPKSKISLGLFSCPSRKFFSRKVPWVSVIPGMS